MLTLLIIVWFVIGVFGVIFWWTKEMDFTTNEIPLAAFGGILGPASWIIGWMVHGDSDTILVKSKK